MKSRKFRYIIKDEYYMPEYSEDEGQNWVTYQEPKMGDLSKSIAFALAGISKRREFDTVQIFFSNTKELFFTKEIYVSAFLGAMKVMNKEVIVNFDQNNEEP